MAELARVQATGWKVSIMSEFVTSLRLLGLSLLVCSIAYPAAILGFAAVVAPAQRAGSLIRDERGTVVGSRLLAQRFTRPEYFWPRPSACDYDASAAGGSNLSPASPMIAERARERIARQQLAQGQRITADLVLASGSGLDPHISQAAALLQVPRVAAARGVPERRVREMVDQHRVAPALLPFGAEPIVNVLELNLALDGLRK